MGKGESVPTHEMHPQLRSSEKQYGEFRRAAPHKTWVPPHVTLRYSVLPLAKSCLRGDGQINQAHHFVPCSVCLVGLKTRLALWHAARIYNTHASATLVKKNTTPHTQHPTSSVFRAFSIPLIRAPLPSWVLQTVGTSSCNYKFRVVRS